MGIERQTYVSTASNGRMTFKRSGDVLEIGVVNADNTVIDKAELSEDDLRGLLKDAFPAKRGPNKAKKPNGAASKKQPAQAQA